MVRNIVVIFGLIITLITTTFAAEKVVVAHRGASGYLPEHTIAAKAMAYAMNPDYIEQDVVMTKDDHLVVLHDHYLDRVTDVQEKYPERKREDGRYYVIDFTLEEIRRLDVRERYRFNNKGKKVAVFPKRFPIDKARFKVHTFSQEIELIQGLNKSTGGDIGIYAEAKSPAFHLAEGKDLSHAMLKTMKAYGYNSKQSKAYYQTFENDELKRVDEKLIPELKMDVKLVQLMGNDDVYKDIITEDGIKALSNYADGIGPSLFMITSTEDRGLTYELTDLVKHAHAAGLEVHPYTFRAEELAIPKFAQSYEGLLELFLYDIGVDGVFTDFPDKTVKFIQGRADK
ncbi:MAG: glycerophosphodiester phosphodiesterase [Emcibacteraceae bacterium]|nr:glycerophosphodiester phosphodiesterase [Emcibacteraceae bacterium]